MSPLACPLACPLAYTTHWPPLPFANAWWGWTQAGLALALATLALWWIGRLSKGHLRLTDALEVTARLPLSPRKTLYIIRVGRRGLVIGASDSGLSSLMELSEDDMRALSPPHLPDDPTSPPSLLARLLPLLSSTAPPATSISPPPLPTPHSPTATQDNPAMTEEPPHARPPQR